MPLILHVVYEILSYFTTTGLQYFSGFILPQLQHIRRLSSANVRKKEKKLKIQNLKFIMCNSFNKVSPAQLRSIYHERYT